jgi:N6-adenosine-specific RNA methylase IME4
MSRYRTIVADPPWHYASTGVTPGAGFGTRGQLDKVALPYPTMTVDDIKALPVASIAERDAHLYLWTTQAYLRDSFDVAEAWGFKVSATLAWCKRPTGLKLGGAFPASLEFVQFCRRGSLPTIGKADKRWWEWPRQGTSVARGQTRGHTHSAKPEAFLDIVEQVSPGPYVELFARRARFGWDYWGDQSLGTAEMGEAA